MNGEQNNSIALNKYIKVPIIINLEVHWVELGIVTLNNYTSAFPHKLRAMYDELVWMDTDTGEGRTFQVR